MKTYSMTGAINLIVHSINCVTKSGFDGYMVTSDDLQSPETIVELFFTDLDEANIEEIREAFSEEFAGVKIFLGVHKSDPHPRIVVNIRWEGVK